jgi:hypothetical protein
MDGDLLIFPIYRIRRIIEFISIYGILCLQRKEARAKAGLRCTDLQTRPTEVLDLTRLTVDELQPLVPPFEAAFQAHMAQWRFDGQPRPTRRYTSDTNCPLRTPEDRLLCILFDLKTYGLQVVHGRLFGTGQSQANQGIDVLLGVLQATPCELGEAPSPSVQEWAKRLRVAAAEAAAVVVLSSEPPTPFTPPAAALTPVAASPLFATMAPSDTSSAPRTRLNKHAVIATRKHATR